MDSGDSTTVTFRPFRVLVVEDDPFTRLITVAILKPMVGRG